MIPYSPDGGINWDQVQREYEWTISWPRTRHWSGKTLGEWCIGIVVERLCNRIDELCSE